MRGLPHRVRPPVAKAVSALAAGLLAGCASLPGTQLIALQGQQLECLVNRGQGPTVVLESGLAGTLDWWAQVWPTLVAEQRNALACNRPGLGRSTPLPVTPASAPGGAEAVARLRAVMQAQQLPPPYVLVGHSLGGLYLQLWARQQPDEVQALVLVDATHPEQLRGAGAQDQWPAWARVGFNTLAGEVGRQELATVDATGQQVLALPPPPPRVAVWVLSAERPMRERSALADDANAKRAALAGLYPGARQVWVDSGHAVPLERPQAVLDAIRQALAGSP